MRQRGERKREREEGGGRGVGGEKEEWGRERGGTGGREESRL